MACNCKNTITSFLGGDVANPTTFLNCGEADGTYNNPLETGKTQCIAEDNVLRILDEYKISGTVKNSGQIVFERTVTGATGGSAANDEWVNDGTYFIPTDASNGALSATSMLVGGIITASGKIVTSQSIEVGVHDGNDVIYIERYSSASPYSQFFAGKADNNVAVGFRFVSRKSDGTQEESFTLLGDDKKATFQGNLVVSGTSTVVNTLSATGVNVGNGNGTVSANTFTAPSITIGQESGVITATTIAAKYSAATITNDTDRTIVMEAAEFRPGTLIELDMGAGTGDLNITLPLLATWYSGKYTFIFPEVPNASSNFVLSSQDTGALHGMVYCFNGQEWINADTTVTFSTAKSYAGTRIEVISTTSDTIMINIWTPADKGHVAYS